MATTNSTAVDMTEVRQIKAQSLGAAAIAKAFGIGRFIRGAKPQAGLRQTDYFDEVIKRVSLCASAGGAAFLKHYTRRSDSRPGAREARRPSGYQVAQAGLRGPSRGRAV